MAAMTISARLAMPTLDNVPISSISRTEIFLAAATLTGAGADWGDNVAVSLLGVSVGCSAGVWVGDIGVAGKDAICVGVDGDVGVEVADGSGVDGAGAAGAGAGATGAGGV